jgi:UDP-N-acetylmuramyl pentapeptide synthase
MKKFFKKIVLDILTWEAKAILKKYKPKVVAITGSVGKTSTKDAIHTVLASTYKTRKSRKSFNRDLSLLLTIVGSRTTHPNILTWLVVMADGLFLILLPMSYPEWLVLEVGADPDHMGFIPSLSSWLKTDIAVFTAFAKTPVHIEYFESREKLFQEKISLVSTLKDTGYLALNYDEPEILELKHSPERKAITFGFLQGANVKATTETVLYSETPDSHIKFPEGISFTVDFSGRHLPVVLKGVLGKQHIYPVLAAAAIGFSEHIDKKAMAEALGAHIPPRGRMNLIPGIKNTLIIDDTYNASPAAVAKGLMTLGEIQATRKIAVLGDMLELGEHSIEQHRRSGELASKIADILVTVGVRSRRTADAALDAKMDENKIFQFETAKEAGKYLERLLKAGDVVYIKGSQAMRMERTVEEIMAEPERKEELLVRQEPYWKREK